jgi:hypothetical protein
MTTEPSGGTMTTTTTDTATTTRVIDVPAYFRSAFNAQVADLVKRAKRLGVTPIETRVLGTREVSESHSNGIDTYGSRMVTHYDIEVIGETPRLEGGWLLLGVLEFTQGGVIVSGDDERLAQFRDADRTCEHCKTKRQRAKVVVAVNEDGRLMRVGTTCLKDAFGYWGTPEQALYSIDAKDDLCDFESEWYGSHYKPLTIDVLTAAVACVDAHGFRPTSFEDSTVAQINARMSRPIDGKGLAEWREFCEATPITEAHAETAAAIIEWGKTLDGNDYLHNLGVVLRCDEAEKYGLLASAPKAFATNGEREQRKAEREAAEPAKVPAPTGRVVVEGEVLTTKFVEGGGETEKMLVLVTTSEGAYKVWSTTPVGIPYDIPRGSVVRFTAALTPSDDDPAFAFASRPTKGEVVSEPAAALANPS